MKLLNELTNIYLLVSVCLRSFGRKYVVFLSRTTKNFNAKNFCDRRQYEYLLPLYTLAPIGETCVASVREEVTHSWPEYLEYQQYQQQLMKDQSYPNPFEDHADNKQHIKFLMTAQRLVEEEATFNTYQPDIQDASFGGCVPPSECAPYVPCALARLRACMSLFVGTHNFHNYTVGKTAADSSAQRHLVKITVSDPVRIAGDLYVRIRLEGQSFMLHQIRKMIGIAVEVARGHCSLHTVNCSLGRGNMTTPLAPSAGLFLDKVSFIGRLELADL